MNARALHFLLSSACAALQGSVQSLWLFRVCVFLLAGQSLLGSAPEQFVGGQILVKVRSADYDSERPLRARGHQVTHRTTMHRLKVRLLEVSEAQVDQILDQLRSDPEVEYAERNGVARVAAVPNDPYVFSGEEWHLQRIHAPGAWNATVGRADIKVAVLDSGVVAGHPDLGTLLPGCNFVNGDTQTADDFGHGTAVAGVIGATGNNGIGVAGLAYGCGLLPVKVVDSSGFASYDAIAQGILYAVQEGARVINISVAGTTFSQVMQDAIDYAWSQNVLVIAAAGNTAGSEPQYPAACNHVIAVAAVDQQDTLASFSSYGAWVTLAAPGETIWTTQRDLANPYAAWRGTSFASPIVAGVAALMLSADPTLSNADVTSILEQTADDLGEPGPDAFFGAGRVNAFRCLAAVVPGLQEDTLPAIQNPEPSIVVDTQAPVLRVVTSPVNGGRCFSPVITVSGTARDNVGVDHVEIVLNGSGVAGVVGNTNWTAQVALAPGTNYLAIRAFDLAGNASITIQRKTFYVVTAPVKMSVSGLGQIAPNLDGRNLEVGRSYVVRAVPGPGQAFAGWNTMAGSDPVLRFVMQPGLELTAAFIASPFPAVKGAYAGLVMHADQMLPENSGYLSLMVNASGRFSGKLLLGGTRRPFTGQFDLNGNAEVPVGPSMSLRVAIDLNGGAAVSGSLASGAWVSAATAARNTFSSTRNPAHQAGVRPFVLHDAVDAATEAGNGAGRIYRSGATIVKGRFADRSAFSAASTLGQTGQFPFFISREQGAEIVIGWLSFPDAGEALTAGTVYRVHRGTNAVATALQAAAVLP